jgi:hypothetical protein
VQLDIANRVLSCLYGAFSAARLRIDVCDFAVPGVDANSVEVTLNNGVLTLSGERIQESSKGDGEPHFRRTERSHGNFGSRYESLSLRQDFP